MSVAISSSPINHDRPLLHSDHQREGRMRTLLDLLNVEKMDGLDHQSLAQSNGAQGNAGLNRWRILKERLGLNLVGCCGVATWRYQSDTVEEVNEEEERVVVVIPPREESESRTNLAEALAAEREYCPTPARVSLMRLLEETADGCGVDGGDRKEVVEGSDRVCCVCMGRRKGAAFIPCGHTYCRVCSRELLLNRGSCPLCNQPILEILDIF